MNHHVLKKGMAAMLSLCLMVSFAGCNRQKTKPNTSEATSQVTSLPEETVNTEFPTYLDVLTQQLAVEETELLQYDAESIKKRANWWKETKKQLLEFQKEELNEQNQALCDSLLSFVESNLRLTSEFAYYENLFQPKRGLQVRVPQLINEYSFATTAELDNYLDLLNTMNVFFDGVTEYLQKQSDDGLFMNTYDAERAVAELRKWTSEEKSEEFARLFTQRLERLSLTQEEQETYESKYQLALDTVVLSGLEKWVETIEQLHDTGSNQAGICWTKNGVKYYEALLERSVGLTDDMSDIIEMVDTALATQLERQTVLTEENPDLPKQLSELEVEQNPETLLASLYTQMTPLYPNLSEASYEISYQDGLEETSGTSVKYDAVKKLILIDTNAGANPRLYGDLLREAIPGKWYQDSFLASELQHEIQKKLLRDGFANGWGNEMEYTYEIENPLYHGDKILSEYARANEYGHRLTALRIEIGIHYEGWTEEETQANFPDTEGITELYQEILSNPIGYATELCGMLKINDLREDVKEQLEENYDEKTFIKILLDSGFHSFEEIEIKLAEWGKINSTAEDVNED